MPCQKVAAAEVNQLHVTYLLSFSVSKCKSVKALLEDELYSKCSGAKIRWKLKSEHTLQGHLATIEKPNQQNIALL